MTVTHPIETITMSLEYEPVKNINIKAVPECVKLKLTLL